MKSLVAGFVGVVMGVFFVNIPTLIAGQDLLERQQVRSIGEIVEELKKTRECMCRVANRQSD